jgi:hypothetical protein
MGILRILKLFDQNQIEKKLVSFDIKNLREVINGSNKVFLCEMSNGNDETIYAIYKPIKGERPLRDFLIGDLPSRELAAYKISKYFGWPNLPPLIIKNGPFGKGSFQLFINHDPNKNYFNLYDEFNVDLSYVMIFDFIILNTDRKAGSVIQDKNNNIWAIDQALTFNPYTRLKTVMFEFNNMNLEEKILSQIEKFFLELNNEKKIFHSLKNLISKQEMESLIERTEKLVIARKIPELDRDYNIPYPLI